MCSVFLMLDNFITARDESRDASKTVALVLGQPPHKNQTADVKEIFRTPMPRPNVDIPNLIKGGVKDYARREDIDQDDAYTKLLRIGLEEEGIFDDYLLEDD